MAAVRLPNSSQSTELSILHSGPCTRAASREMKDQVEGKRLQPCGSRAAPPPFELSDGEILPPTFPARHPTREDVAPTGSRGHLTPRTAIAQNQSQQILHQAATQP